MDVSCLKLGVVVPEDAVPWWMGEMIRSIREVSPCCVALLAPQCFGLAVPNPWKALLGLDRFLTRSRPDVLAPRPLDGSVFPLAQAAGLGLDAVIAPAGTLLPDGLMESLPLGLWSLERPHPERFGDGWVESRLLLHRAVCEPRLLCNSFSSVGGPWPLSWLAPLLAKAAGFPARVLARLAVDGPELFETLPEVAPLPAFSPGLKDWLVHAGRLSVYGLTRAWQDVFHRRQWFLAWRQGGDGLGQAPFIPWLPPDGSGWADPFIFVTGEGTFLFIEEIPPSGRGVISVLKRRQDGTWSAPRRVLEEPFHLSYPQVFAHDGEIYMVPESAQAGRVGLYRAKEFPGGWELECELLSNVPAVDATLFERDGRWWMFVNLRAPGGSSWDELHLYSAPDLRGPYTPHPLNPVVSDVRRARPAGRIFERGGKLYRPGQDCSGWYGKALSLMEIKQLDEKGYAEELAAHLGPELIPGSFCLHTLEFLEGDTACSQAGLELVDGQRFVPIWKPIGKRGRA